MLIRMLALSLLAPLLLLGACGDDDDNATNTPKPAAATTAAGGAATTAAGNTTIKEITVTAADFSLTPATISAAVGQTVKITLNNTGAVEHSFTVGDKDVTEAEGGDEATGEFVLAAGQTEFHCKYHPTQMKGTITAGASSQNLDPTETVNAAAISGFGY